MTLNTSLQFLSPLLIVSVFDFPLTNSEEFKKPIHVFMPQECHRTAYGLSVLESDAHSIPISQDPITQGMGRITGSENGPFGSRKDSLKRNPLERQAMINISKAVLFLALFPYIYAMILSNRNRHLTNPVHNFITACLCSFCYLHLKLSLPPSYYLETYHPKDTDIKVIPKTFNTYQEKEAMKNYLSTKKQYPKKVHFLVN